MVSKKYVSANIERYDSCVGSDLLLKLRAARMCVASMVALLRRLIGIVSLLQSEPSWDS